MSDKEVPAGGVCVSGLPTDRLVPRGEEVVIGLNGWERKAWVAWHDQKSGRAGLSFDPIPKG